MFSSLSIRSVEFDTRLDRPAPIGLMASAVMRGVTGWLLAEQFPAVADRFFKPGQGGNQPSAFVTQLLRRTKDRRTISARFITFDRDGELADAFRAVLPLAAGRPFGAGMIRIASVHPAAVTLIQPSPCAESPCFVYLLTPVLLAGPGGSWLGPETLTFPALALGAARRVNTLSVCYGDGTLLDEADICRAAEKTHVISQNLCWLSLERHSTTQAKAIKLSGAAGGFAIGHMPSPLRSLFSLAMLAHVGKHAADGCGRVEFTTDRKVI